MTQENEPSRWAVLDWRRRVGVLYALVRAQADPVAGHHLWREGRDELLGRHPASPIPPDQRPRFTGLTVGEYDPGYRFEVEVAVAEPALREVPTGTDGVVRMERVGVMALPGIGSLDVWWLAQYGGGVFVPVRDGLAGTTTFGGGRYVLDTAKGADLGPEPQSVPGNGQRLVIDLNFAYNPSCAYDPAWACPLAPPGNTVTADLPVGEATFNPPG